MPLLAKADNAGTGGTISGSAPFIDPRSYGAVFDGVHDDTTAWQAALNALANTENPPLLIAPAGFSKITDQLVLKGSNHAKIIAPGCILKAGVTMSGKAILKIFDACFVQIDGLSIDGDFKADYCLWCDADDTDPATHPPEVVGVTAQNLYHNLDIRNAVVEGVRIASSTSDNFEVDTMHFSSCRFRGSNKNVGVHSGNSVRIVFDGQSTFGRYSAPGGTQYPPDWNIYVERGGISLIGVTMEQAQQFDVYLGTGSYLFASDWYTESKKVLQTGFQGSFPYPTVIEYLNQNVNSDDGDPISMDWNFAGYLHLASCRIGGNVSLAFGKYGSTAERIEFAPNRGFVGAAAGKISVVDTKSHLIAQPLVVSNILSATYTDLIIDGSDNTKCTSAANPFTAAQVGETLQITGGTGFTVQDVVIYAVDGSHVAYCIAALGTAGSTGGQATIGGVETAFVNGNGYLTAYPLNFYSLARSAIHNIASIQAETTGEGSDGSIGDLIFQTKRYVTDTAPGERLRITFDGKIQLPYASVLGWKQGSSLDTYLYGLDVQRIGSNSEILVTRDHTTDVCFDVNVTADTNARWLVNAGGEHWFGTGSATVDVKFYRRGAGALGIDGTLTLTIASGAAGLNVLVTGDSYARLEIDDSGGINMGPGNIPQDVRLYRGGTTQLNIDGSLVLQNQKLLSWSSGAFIVEDATSDLDLGFGSSAALHLVHDTLKVYANADFQVIGNLMNNTGTLVDASGNANFVSLKIGGVAVIDSGRNGDFASVSIGGLTRLDASGNGSLVSLTLNAPLAIAQGGTGATSASVALSNLGAATSGASTGGESAHTHT
jgi:hypothetical protein